MGLVLASVAAVFLLGPAAGAAEPDRKEVAARLAKLPDELAKAKKADAEVVDGLFLATLLRLPTDEERGRVTKYLNAAKDRQDGCRQVTWALINTKEFLKVQGFGDDVAAGLQFGMSISAAWDKKK